MKQFSTKNWLIGILAAGWIATFVVGFLHGAEIIHEIENPLIHTTRDWIIVSVVLVPATYFITSVLDSKKPQNE